MAGGIFSLVKLFGMTLRESANDGSDFTNPDADYRRLFLGEDGVLHLKDSAGVVTAPGLSLASGKTVRTAGDLTYTSATFADVTGASITITTGARRCLVVVNASGLHSASTFSLALDIDLDGSRLGTTTWGLMRAQAQGNGRYFSASFAYLTDALSAASHTFKLQAATDGATATLNATDPALTFAVMEQAG